MEYRKKKGQAAIVCCSDGLGEEACRQTSLLCRKLMGMGLEPVVSPFLARGETIFSGTAAQRGQDSDGLLPGSRNPYDSGCERRQSGKSDSGVS